MGYQTHLVWRVCIPFFVLGSLSCADPVAQQKIQQLEAANATLQRSVAGPNAYQCLVTGVRELDDKGALVEAAPKFRDQVVGRTFVVDRTTGVIVGSVGGNGNFESRSVVFTPPENPFYIVSTTIAPNRNVEFLAVRDWVAGRDKPFVLADATHVFTGTCQS